MTIQDQAFRLTAVLPFNDSGYRSDHLLVADMVEPGSKVLDVGCGEGELLRLLETRGVDGRGIELSREGVNHCVGKGLAVVQGDADADLVNYPDDAFDYVILSQTLQATRQPRVVLENLLRIGQRAIVSFEGPDAAYRQSSGDMVRHAEHSFLHHQGFRSALRRDQRQDGARRRARPVRASTPAQRAMVVLEYVR